MHAFLALAALTAASPVAAPFAAPVPEDLSGVYDSAGALAGALAPHLVTGSLLFSEGDSLAVKTFTRSPYTHVAAVVREGDRLIVYDSQRGAGVRKNSLLRYLTLRGDEPVHVVHPAGPLPDAAAFARHLEAELGRPYAVAHHLCGRRVGGLHCAEYLTDALIAARLVTADRPPKVSPASLRRGLLGHELYRRTAAVRVRTPPPPRSAPARSAPGWCERMWADTTRCVADCWASVRRGIPRF